MTESDIWRKLSNWLPGYATRMENLIGTGMTDVLWCPRGIVVFIENKILKGTSIYVRNSQMVFGLEIRPSVPDHQHLFVVGKVANPSLICYTYSNIAKLPSVVIAPGKLKVDMKDAIPDYIWEGRNDINNYLKKLEEQYGRS